MVPSLIASSSPVTVTSRETLQLSLPKVSVDGETLASVVSLLTSSKTTLPVGAEVNTTEKLSVLPLSARVVALSDSVTVKPGSVVVKLSSIEPRFFRAVSLSILLSRPCCFIVVCRCARAFAAEIIVLPTAEVTAKVALSKASTETSKLMDFAARVVFVESLMLIPLLGSPSASKVCKRRLRLTTF